MVGYMRPPKSPRQMLNATLRIGNDRANDASPR
jgi:hypothetical protein